MCVIENSKWQRLVTGKKSERENRRDYTGIGKCGDIWRLIARIFRWLTSPWFNYEDGLLSYCRVSVQCAGKFLNVTSWSVLVNPKTITEITEHPSIVYWTKYVQLVNLTVDTPVLQITSHASVLNRPLISRPIRLCLLTMYYNTCSEKFSSIYHKLVPSQIDRNRLHRIRHVL